jgi:poly(A) polymerase
LLAHPRFRAAYDFLVLRQSASNEHAEEAQFWREAQLSAGDAGVEGDLDPLDAEGMTEGEGESRPRRRRRRRSGGATGAA